MNDIAENKQTEDIDRQGIAKCKICFSHREAERNGVQDVLKFATDNNVHSHRVQRWFVEGGYSLATARTYASQLRTVKKNPKIREKVRTEEVSFNQGVKEAQKESHERKYGWEIMLNALSTFVRLAIKFEMNFEWMKSTLENEYAKQTKQS